MGAYGFRSQDYFIVRRRPVAVADVIHNRSGENEAVLHHDAHLRAQRMQRHLGDIRIININRSAADIVEAAQQVDNGGFSRASRPYDSEGFAGHGREAHVIQCFYALLVGEGYMVKGNFANDRRHFHCAGGVLDSDRLVDGFKNTFQIGNGR